MRLLVTRPLPGGATTAMRLRALGHEVILSPLMASEAVAWTLPSRLPPAVMLTSAFAARLAGPTAAALHSLPVFAVGAATARAAIEVGFVDVRDGGGTAQALVDSVAALGLTEILHLAGEDRTPVVLPAGLLPITRTVYRARLLPLQALPLVDWALLYSPRSAGHFAAEADRIGIERSTIGVAAISAAALAAAGDGWRETALPASPTESALLAAIGISCQ